MAGRNAAFLLLRQAQILANAVAISFSKFNRILRSSPARNVAHLTLLSLHPLS